MDNYGVSRPLADKALHLPVVTLGDSFVVASGSVPGETYTVTPTGSDWRAWNCDCVAPGACSHKLAAAAYAATAARRASIRMVEA